MIPFYKEKIRGNRKVSLKMLHFFINTGIKDTAYYWNELHKCIQIYCDLKKLAPELDSLNIGGGFPIKNSLAFDYDYEYMTEEIVAQVKNMCNANGVEEPNLFTEFGSFTVGESGAALFSIINQKQQNDRESWYMIDSFVHDDAAGHLGYQPALPAAGHQQLGQGVPAGVPRRPHVRQPGLLQRRGPLQCGLPAETDAGETQYIGFFHTGAYQESLGGFGGIQHCLIPAPKHIIIDRDKSDNEYYTRLFAKEQSYRSMMRILGY